MDKKQKRSPEKYIKYVLHVACQKEIAGHAEFCLKEC
jgi:hypothetical protein